MTIEEFLSARVGVFAYNPTMRLFGIVNSSNFGIVTDLANMVAKALQNDSQTKHYTLYLNRCYYSDGGAPNAYDIDLTWVIPIDSRDDWELYKSVLDIPDQRVVNKVLLIEMRKMKAAMATPGVLPSQPAITIPPTYVHNSLDLM